MPQSEETQVEVPPTTDNIVSQPDELPTQAEPQTDVSEPEAKPEIEAVKEPDTVTEAEAISEPQPEAEVIPETHTEAVKEPEVIPESEIEPAVEDKLEPEPEVVSQETDTISKETPEVGCVTGVPEEVLTPPVAPELTPVTPPVEVQWRMSPTHDSGWASATVYHSSVSTHSLSHTVIYALCCFQVK